MKCVKCGKKIPKGVNKLCEDCQKKLILDLQHEDENPKKNVTTKKIDNGKFNTFEIIFVVICIIIIVTSIGVSSYELIKRKIKLNQDTFSTTNAYLGNRVGNTIANIRNYGYCAMDGDWIYYHADNDDFSMSRICKIKNNGVSKSIIYEDSDISIYSINALNGYIYFTGILSGEYSSADEIDNKIYRMKNDGSDLEVINDNNFSNLYYSFYAIDDKIYFVGTDNNIYKMNLDGTAIEKISDNQSGFLGVTEKYILFDKYETENENYTQETYIMNLDGSNARAVLPGKNLTNVNIENDYIYYINEDKYMCRTKIDSNEEEIVQAKTTYLLNVFNNYAYFFDYVSEDFAPELIKSLTKISYYLDIVGDFANYLDSNNKYVSLNLLKTDGSLVNYQLYTYNINDIQQFFGNDDVTEEETDSSQEENEENE